MSLANTGMHASPGAIYNLLRSEVEKLEPTGEEDCGRKERRLCELRNIVDSAVRKAKARLEEQDAADPGGDDADGDDSGGGGNGTGGPDPTNGQGGPPSPATAKAPITVFDPWQKRTAPPFPDDVLPPLLQEYIDSQSAVIGTCQSAMAMSALTACSGALSHEFTLRQLRNSTWIVRPRLWTLLIGPASHKKTPPINAAIEPLLHREARLTEQHMTAMAEYARTAAEKDPKAANAEIAAKAPKAPPRYLSWNTTTEALGQILAANDGRGILAVHDELSGWIGSMDRYHRQKSGDRGWWLKAYDGGPMTVDRITRGTVYIKNLSVSILGGIQPELLAKYDGLTADGLLQRFVPVMMSETTFREDRPSNHNGYKFFVEGLIALPPRALEMTDEAVEAMAGLHKTIFDLSKTFDGMGAYQSFLGKLDGMCGSLALILHLASGRNIGGLICVDESGGYGSVGAGVVEKVRKIILDFVIPNGLEFYLGGHAPEAEQMRRLASYVLTSNKDKIRASDLTKNIADFRGMKLGDLNHKVSVLVAAGWLNAEERMPTCRAWRVNPQVRIELAGRRIEEEERKQTITAMLRSRRKT
jgi:hypothetical protein